MSSATATAGSAESFDRFLAALERGDIGGLTGALCRDACFLTQDRTPIGGRERVASLLAQLARIGLRVDASSRWAIELADFALLGARLQIQVPAAPRPLVQAADSTFVLAHRESRWKLLLIAPWGWR